MSYQPYEFYFFYLVYILETIEPHLSEKLYLSEILKAKYI